MPEFPASPRDLTPWIVDCDSSGPSATTSWGVGPVVVAALYGGYSQSSNVQNAEIDWDVVLGAGVWTVQLVFAKNVNTGIFSVQLDGVEVGSVDSYAAASANNAIVAIAGVPVIGSGKHRVGLKMATKNAASTGFIGLVQHLQLRRTA